MDRGTIALRYAKALLLYARGHGVVEGVYHDTQALSDGFRTYPALRRVLENRLLTREQKMEAVRACSGPQPTAQFERFVDLLLERRREELLPDICLDYRDLVRREENLMDVTVTTATEVDAATAGRFESTLRELTGKSVRLHAQVDPSLIGGYVMRWDTYRLDRSVSGMLKRIERQLAKS